MSELDAPEVSIRDYRAITFWSWVMTVATFAWGIPWLAWTWLLESSSQPVLPFFPHDVDRLTISTAALLVMVGGLQAARTFKHMRQTAFFYLKFSALYLPLGFVALLLLALVLLEPIFLLFFILYLFMCSPLYFMLRLYRRNKHAFR